MMPTPAVEENAPQQGRNAPRDVVGLSSRDVRPRDFDAAVCELSRLLCDPARDGLDALVEPALEVLARGLDARRIDFFASRHLEPIAGARPASAEAKGFVLAARWNAPLPAEIASLDLEAYPTLATALEAGRVHRHPAAAPATGEGRPLEGR